MRCQFKLEGSDSIITTLTTDHVPAVGDMVIVYADGGPGRPMFRGNKVVEVWHVFGKRPPDSPYKDHDVTVIVAKEGE